MRLLTQVAIFVISTVYTLENAVGSDTGTLTDSIKKERRVSTLGEGDDLVDELPGESDWRTTSFPDALACTMRTRSVMTVAHRARVSTQYAENSISGAQTALESGMSAVEIDIRVTRDGVLLLNHDDTLERTTTGSGLVSELRWDDIKQYKLKLGDGTVLDENPARLSDYLINISNRSLLMVDLKDPSSTIPAVNLIVASGRGDRTAFIVYDRPQAKVVRSIYPPALIALGIADETQLQANEEHALSPPIIALMGDPFAARKTLVTLAVNDGYYVLGGSYLGSPSLEKRLAAGDSSVDFQQLISDGFSLLVANEGDIVTSKLKSVGALLQRSRCVHSHLQASRTGGAEHPK